MRTSASRLSEKYENGKQVVFIVIALLSFAGSIVDYFTYTHNAPGPLKIIFWCATLVNLATIVYYFVGNKKLYPILFAAVAYSVILHIFLSHALFGELQVARAGSTTEIFIRDTLFAVCFISLSAFISGRIHAFVQAGIHFSLFFVYAFYLKEPFVQENLVLFIMVFIGFGLVINFMAKLVDSFINRLNRYRITIELQNNVLAENNKEITSSIEYAKEVQKSTLPSLQLEDLFRSSFIMYRPRDIVSGDFYWLEENDKYKHFAVADCTGHGIPGAFISLIGTILLNEIYNSKSMRAPSEILNELNRLICLTLEDKEIDLKDGMDISFCSLDKMTNELHFAGAINPLWIISKDEHKSIAINGAKEELLPELSKNGFNFFSISANPFPVGNYFLENKNFENRTVQLSCKDQLFLFSDGYADQFGGVRGKKLQKRRFKDVLIDYADIEMELKGEKIEAYFDTWKAEHDQLDDVCVLGVEV